jgi:hypothetical protein
VLRLGSRTGWIGWRTRSRKGPIMGSTLGSVPTPTPVPGLFPGSFPGPEKIVGVTLRLEERNPIVASYRTFILELEPLIPYTPPMLYVLLAVFELFVLAFVPVSVLFVVLISSIITVLLSRPTFLLR